MTMDARQREARILELMPLVRALAGRYARRGEPLDDLVQVGTIGLIKAVDRFDPTRGSDLASFATPTILGEIRRHFRDKTWMVHVPRSVQDAHRRINLAVDELTAQLGRSPSVREIADATDLTEDETLDAIAATSAYQPMSLSRRPAAEEDEPMDIGVVDSGFDLAEGRASLGDRFFELPEREQLILLLRLQRGMTQSEIAKRVGISQMHVSRLIAKALKTLREKVGADEVD